MNESPFFSMTMIVGDSYTASGDSNFHLDGSASKMFEVFYNRFFTIHPYISERRDKNNPILISQLAELSSENLEYILLFPKNFLITCAQSYYEEKGEN